MGKGDGAEPGKIAACCAHIEAYPQAVRGDLWFYYQRKLSGLFTGDFTWADLDSMLTRLPADSALQTAIRDQYTDAELAEASQEQAGHGQWGRINYQLADIADAVRVLSWLFISANTPEDKPKPHPPVPVARPGVLDPNAEKRAKVDRNKERWLKRQQAREQAREQARAEGE